MVEKITTYRCTCDLCGATVENLHSLPDGWVSGYNRDIHVCAVCGNALFRTTDVNVLKEYCLSQDSCDECIMNDTGTCGLQHVPEDNNWLDCSKTFNQNSRPIFANAVMHIRELCIQRDCTAESSTSCKYLLENGCMFKHNAPRDWTVDK